MSKIITVGLDLAKNVFQVHGADGAGRAQEAGSRAGSAVFQPATGVRCRDGNLLRRSLLGPGDMEAGPVFRAVAGGSRLAHAARPTV